MPLAQGQVLSKIFVGPSKCNLNENAFHMNEKSNLVSRSGLQLDDFLLSEVLMHWCLCQFANSISLFAKILYFRNSDIHFGATGHFYSISSSFPGILLTEQGSDTLKNKTQSEVDLK